MTLDCQQENTVPHRLVPRYPALGDGAGLGDGDGLAARRANPKQLFGDLKPNLALVPGAALIGIAMALEMGAAKYGPYNWRRDPIEAMTYIAAALRHLAAWTDGEDAATDSRLSHIDHAMASLAILKDAETTGNLIDNRPIPGNTAALLEQTEQQRRAALRSIPQE